METELQSHNTSKIAEKPLWFFILLVGVICFSRLCGSSYMYSSNDRSRWCTIRSLVEDRTYIIDRVINLERWNNIDKVRHEEHFYSSKIPLFPTIVAGLDYVILKVTGWNFDRHMWEIHLTTLFIVNILPFMLSVRCLASLISTSGTSQLAQWIVLIVYSLGSAMTPFMCTLNNHTPAAIGLIFSLWGLALVQRSGNIAGFAVAGFCSSTTFTFELPAILLVLWTAYICIQHSRSKTLAMFLPAALVPIALMFYTNVIVTGGIKPFYSYYGTEKYVYEFWGIPSYWSHPQGIDSAKDSSAVYLFHCLIGHHGIFSLTPVFVFSLVFWLGCFAFQKYPLWKTSVAGGVISLIVLSFYMTRTENYNFGGSSVSLRWMIWTFPFFLISALPVIDLFLRKNLGMIVVAVLMSGSIFSAWFPLINAWSQPWIFLMLEKQGIIDYEIKPAPYSYPHLLIIDQLPQGQNAVPDYWVEYAYTDSHNQVRVFKLQDDGDVREQGKTWRRILLTGRIPGEEKELAIPILVSTELIKNESSNGDSIIRFPGSTPQEISLSIRQFLRGFPGVETKPDSTYNPGMTEYLFLTVQKNAIRCQLGNMSFTKEFKDKLIPDPGYQITRKFTSRIWNSEELPFGLARWQFQIISNIDNSETGIVTVSAIRAGKIMPRK